MPEETVWICDDVVLAIHDAQIAEHGGAEGIRDRGLLESALARPKNVAAYGEPAPDIAALAGTYALGIIRNHPFVDGNKRVGFVLLELFLRLNGHVLAAADAEVYEAVMSSASGKMVDEDLFTWIREHLRYE